MTQYSIESVASIRNKTKETIRVDTLIPEELRTKSETLISFLKDYYQYCNESGNPSYQLNSINNARDLDAADAQFLDKLQNEIAYAFPRSISADRVKLYKNLVQYYSLRGSAESIQLFFKILFGDNAEVYYPREDLLIASDGVWEPDFQNLVYTKNPLVYVKGNGSSAYGEATVNDGVITSIEVTNGGSNYTTASVTITGDGEGAAATAVIGNGAIYDITVDVPGSEYITAEVVITDSSGGPGTGAEAIAIIGSGGGIDQIYVTNPGKDYINPVASITGTQGSGGTPADLTAYSNYRKVVSVAITSGGKGYTTGGTSASITGNGTLATLGTPAIKDGVITAIQVKNEGSGYTVASAEVYNDENAVTPVTSPAIIWPNVVVETPGISVDPADVGKILSYTVVDGGEGYTTKGTIVGTTTGRYTDNRGFLSDLIRLQDSYFWQKYSYVVKTGNNVESWKYIFDKLVHPSGFIYFGEILVLIELLLSRAKMPFTQPGLAGDAELTFRFLIQLLNMGVTYDSSYYSSTLEILDTVPDTDLVRSEDPMHINIYSGLTIQEADGFSQETPVSPLYPWGDYTIAYASSINTVNTINGVTYSVSVVPSYTPVP